MKKIDLTIALMLVILALPVLSAVNRANTTSSLNGNGKIITEDRPVASFHALKVSGGIDIELSQGNELKLQVEADENLVPIIRTEVKDGVLCIWHDEKVMNAKTMKIHLTFKNLDAITASGGCDIVSSQKLNFNVLKTDLSGGCDIKLDCKADNLICEHSGGCDAKLSGEAENSTFKVSGGCDVKAQEFSLKNCNIDASGGSDVIVNVKGDLTAKATGASDITYYGEPAKVNKSASGASEVHGK